MAKEHIKSGSGAPPRAKRTLEVSDGVRVVMAGLSPTEKGAVEVALRSPAAVRRLPVEHVARTVGGDVYVARATPRLRLIYRITPQRIEVTDLLNAGAVTFLLRPTASAKKTQPKEHTVRRPTGTTRPRTRSALKPLPDPATQLATNT